MALGVDEVDQHLGLTERERFDAQGNAMDPAAVQCRLRPLLAAWAADPSTVPRHTFPPPHRVQLVYDSLRDTILRQHGPDGDGTVDPDRLFAIHLPRINLTAGIVEDALATLSGPGGRGP